MLHAIERLTNLYDLSKAFGSTISVDDLTRLIVRKAADFATAEMASLWLLQGEELVLAASATNDNYDVEHAPDAVGATVAGDILADQAALRRNRIPESDPLHAESPTTRSAPALAVPLVEEELSIGALVLVNEPGAAIPSSTPEQEELLQDVARQAVRALAIARRA